MVFWFALSKLLLISRCNLVAVNAKEHILYSSGSFEALTAAISFSEYLVFNKTHGGRRAKVSKLGLNPAVTHLLLCYKL